MKKGIMILGGVLGAALCLSSCTASLDDIKNDLAFDGGYGSVVVNGENARKLDVSLIGFANASVSGKGIEKGSEPKVLNIDVTDGTGSFVIDKIPAGKNRIVTVQALNSSKSEIFNVTMRAVCDVEVGKQTSISVDWSTTPYANTLYYINEKGGDVSLITDTDKQKILSLIDKTVSPLLINYESLATDFINKTLQDSSSSYLLSPASISVNLGEGASGNFKIQVCDPSSEVYLGTGTTGTFTGIAPGTWSIYLYDAAGEKVKTKTATFKSGSITEVSFVTVTDKIIVHAYNYTTIWSWTKSTSQNFTGGTWPGLAMEKENDAWYKFELPLAAEMVIFSNKGAGQTADLVLPGAGEWWYKDGKWYDEDPTDSEAPSIVSFTPSVDPLTDVSGIVKFTLTASDNKKLSKAYFKVNNTLYKTVAFSELSDIVTLEWDSALYKNGSYTISVYVEDTSKNVSKEESISLTTKNENLPPVAAITGPSKIGTGGKTQTYKSSSYDPNGTIVSYKWVVTGATIEGESDKSEVKVKFPENAGSKVQITLTVKDDDGASAFVTKDAVVEQLKAIDFREETIYFAMTTRFFDGDKSNNVHCWDENETTPADDPAWRGDFEGLIEKLDYIKALGFSAIWITPIVENCSGLDYHGYHAMNLKKIDPRYGTGKSDVANAEKDFQRLIDAAHDRDMKIVLDVVFNHVGNFGEATLCKMFEKDYSANLENINECLIIPDDSELLKQFPTYATMKPADQYGSRLALMKNTDYKNHDYRNYFHHFGFGNWDNFSVQFFQMAGDCVELNTENPKVLEYIGDAYSKYIEMGVDAFRIDTGKHLSRLEFNYYLNDRFIETAKSCGRDNFYMFTEICAKSSDVTYRGNVENLSPYFYTWKDTSDYGFTMEDRDQFEGVIIYPESAETEKDEVRVLRDLDYWTRPTVDGGTKTPVNALAVQKQGMDTTNIRPDRPVSDNHLLHGNEYHKPDYTMRSGLDVIDFPMHWNFGTAQGAFGVRGGDKYYNDATWNVVYVDSHDYGPGDQFEKRYQRDDIFWAENVDLMFTFRGIPCLYYGSEVGFMKGAIIDKGPVLPLCETGRAYFGDYLEGDVKASDFSEYTASGTVADTLNHPLAKHIQRMNKIRRAIPALQKGQYSTENCSGSMAFKRRYTDETSGVDSFALVTISGDSTFSGLPAGTYVDVITGDIQKLSEGGSITTTGCDTQSNMRVYVLQNKTATDMGADGKIGDDGEYLK